MKKKGLSSGNAGKLFEQIYDYILDRIRRGEWKPHEKLPSIPLAGDGIQCTSIDGL